MRVLPANTSLNMTHNQHISSSDTNGSIIYILGVIVWYALGFSLILLDDIDPQPGRIESHKYVSVYQTVTDLHEHQAQNDILVELKDKKKRAKLWEIYYGTQMNHPATVQKDEKVIELIIKQLNELNERRRLLRYTLNGTSIDKFDDEHDHAHSDSESLPSLRMIGKHRSNGYRKRYSK